MHTYWTQSERNQNHNFIIICHLKNMPNKIVEKRECTSKLKKRRASLHRAIKKFINVKISNTKIKRKLSTNRWFPYIFVYLLYQRGIIFFVGWSKSIDCWPMQFFCCCCQIIYTLLALSKLNNNNKPYVPSTKKTYFKFKIRARQIFNLTSDYHFHNTFYT